MKLFSDLSLEEQEHHLRIVSQLLVGNVYRFKPAIRAVPLERLIKGLPASGVPVKFSYGQFLRFRDWPSKFRDCLFLVQTRDRERGAGRFDFVVPLLFTSDLPPPRLV
ncbi:MAG: hypothetical protein HYT47_01100 [Candidatus Vogelbacteria bacterium]|nr:hypothetical protein [Candidatus Vogelbacteria bacterium]